jgi:phosphopentomutase
VFQIACHIDTIPLAKQYQWCQIARDMLQGQHRVGRVICRPFAGKPGSYERVSRDRRDYSVPPPEATLLDQAKSEGLGVLGIGKIEDIFDKQGLSHAIHTGSNKEGLELTLQAIEEKLPLEPITIVDQAPNTVQFIFSNLVDTDMLFGHRRNVEGYANALVEFDQWLGKIMQALKPSDLLVITSDHGNDPTAPGTDHTREYVPVLLYSPSLSIQETTSEQRNVQVRKGFIDVAATLNTWLGLNKKIQVGQTMILQPPAATAAR